MRFVAKSLDCKEVEITKIISYEINSSVEVPCDSIRLFYCSNSFKEFVSIKVFDGRKIVFNGLIDKQSRTQNKNGVTDFLFARSTASILVDNEASPITYQNPSISSLFHLNAEQFGFKNRLPELSFFESFEIPKGSNCFSVLQNFISAFSNYLLYVSPKNELKIYEKSKEIKKVKKANIIQIKSVINRGTPISNIDYIVDSKNGYDHFIESNWLKSRQILRKRNMNVGNIPPWQKLIKIETKMKNSAKKYFEVQLTLVDDDNFELFDLIQVEDFQIELVENFYVYEKDILFDNKGKKCVLTLVADLDLEETNYVDK